MKFMHEHSRSGFLLIFNCNVKYFSTIGHTFASKIPCSDASIDDYNRKITKNSLTIFLAPTNQLEISYLIDTLPNKKSSGWDSISNVLLKSMKCTLCKPLTILFNRSITDGVFPDIFKRADVIALYKKGLTNLPNIYRPISLLLTMSKLLEKLLYKCVYSFLTTTNQIYQCQYGF